MTRFAIIVEFRLRPGTLERFMPLVLENAAASVRDEPGCSRFDVMTPYEGGAEPPDQVTLYEIYEDAAAFQAHLATPHYARFKAATDELIEGRLLRRFEVRENAAP